MTRAFVVALTLFTALASQDAAAGLPVVRRVAVAHPVAHRVIAPVHRIVRRGAPVRGAAAHVTAAARRVTPSAVLGSARGAGHVTTSAPLAMQAQSRRRP